jgi:hypothetical protein
MFRAAILTAESANTFAAGFLRLSPGRKSGVFSKGSSPNAADLE